ncbi:methyltransferase domain-containing protein [Desulfococcaceae bacterium HSG7]|nr:methyltransferase domain-containing protein [Desulfococcaceae bacterium HSG7]
MLKNIEFARRFDTVADSFDQMISAYSTRRRHEAILPYIRGKVLCVGSGTGYLNSCCHKNDDIIHLDISMNMCGTTVEKTGASAVCADAESLPVTDKAIDTVTALEMIYYLNNPKHFIKEAYRILRPGGVLLLSSFNHKLAFYDKYIRTIARKLPLTGTYFDDGNRRFMYLNDLRNLLCSNGFEIIMQRSILTIPIESLKRLDECLEKTFISRLAMFNIMAGKK